MIPAAVTEWVRSIIVYMLLVSVLMHLLPDEKYQKYVRIFAGFILLLLVIEPLRNVSPEDTLAEIFSDFESATKQETAWDKRVEEIREAADKAGTETVFDAYRQQIEKRIASLVSERGYALQEADITLTENGIERLSVRVTPMRAEGGEVAAKIGRTETEDAAQQTGNAREQQLCDILCEAYQLENSVVSVTISEG